MSPTFEVLAKGADLVASKLGRARVGVVLGSGLSEALDNLEHPQYLPYSEVPGMAAPTTVGHRGAIVRGESGGVPVLGLCGRVHLYEGKPGAEVVAGVRLLSLLGVQSLIVTSAVGSTKPELGPGDLMLVEDHINLSGANALMGEHDARFGSRFPDVSVAYDPGLRASLAATAELVGVPLASGILAQFLGPSFETPAEVRMAAQLGASVVSMSMVPEVLAARQRGMRVAGIACVTNYGGGVTDEPIRHEDVLVHSASLAANVGALLLGGLGRLTDGPEQPRTSSR